MQRYFEGVMVAAGAAVLSGLLVLVSACDRRGRPSDVTAVDSSAGSFAAVDEARLTGAGRDSANWMSYGRTYDEQRFSPLSQVNAHNVAELRLAWHFDLPTDARGQESTPLVIDGVMYVTSAWSKVFALDARTGALLWSYDPQVPGEWAVNACCDVVNRGVAAWNGRLYLGTLDGRLVALEAATGKPVWEKLTIDRAWPYTITGAPRVVKGKVLIGNAGAEMGVRGYISAYDADSGTLAWRFYTVPGEPGKVDGAASDKVLEEKARPTWTGEWWKLGGGGTVWDAMAYDPKLDLLYIGVGNGSPWNQKLRSPGGGDNLFLSSIVALRPDSGEYVWHFQGTPGETWDFTATQHLILADLNIDGRSRPVILQAPKNGFFYVLNRATGEFISARPYAQVNWATAVDPKTGRPVENPQARYDMTGKPFLATPGAVGAHNWQPMSFSPATGLVYIPVNDLAFPYLPDSKFVAKKLAFNVGLDFNLGDPPKNPAVRTQAISAAKGHLAAWDPVAQREVWRVEYSGPGNGGLLSTAGNLVFGGTSAGEFHAYQADTGTRLWSAATQAGVIAAPISYEVNGKQYVAIEVGWGGAFALGVGELGLSMHPSTNTPRVLVFALDGTDQLPQTPPAVPKPLQPPNSTANAQVVTQGQALYARQCSRCHGGSAVSAGVLPDLRYAAALGNRAAWQSIVHDGALKGRGMIGFSSDLDKDQIETIRAYVIHRANEQLAENRSALKNAK